MSSIEDIKKLREITGAGINSVKEALKETNNNFDEAVKYLRQKGVAKADKRKDKEAKNGVLGVYVHTNNSLVAVVEVLCETDFAAKSPDMLKFANDLAVHIAAADPVYIDETTVPEKILNAEKEVFEKELKDKPESIRENILKGKLEKFYKQFVLTHQDFFIDDKKTVQDYINEVVAKIGEKIVINSFSRFRVAQEPQSCNR